MRRRICAAAACSILSGVILHGCGPSGAGDSLSPASARTGELYFVNVTTRAGLAAFAHRTGAFGAKWLPETMGGGVGFIDYDRDSWADILLVGGGTWSSGDDEPVRALWLFRNNRDGTFSDVTEEAGLGSVQAYGFGIAVADYDNDGDDDFFFTTLSENALFRNDGGTFTDIAATAGVTGEPIWSTAALFFDADRDGWLDLFVGNYVEWSPELDIVCTADGTTKSYCQPTLYQGLSSNLFRNNGDGTFSDVTTESGLDGLPGKTLGAAELDYNRDGWPDLVVANDTERDLLVENDGDGSFTEKGVLSGVAFDEDGRARGGMGIDAGVVDRTGQESIFVGNFSNEMIGVYRHSDSGLFLDRAAASRIGRPSLRKVTFGLFLFDSDLDGDLDLFAANGHIREEDEAEGGVPYRQEAQLFLNDGDGNFALFEPSAGDALATPMVARGAAYADYDLDGDIDLLVVENGGRAHLWRNEVLGSGPDRDGVRRRHALRVRLQGRESNRDGIGAEVEVVVGDARMRRRIRSGSSYLSQSERIVTVGLGAAVSADSLIVRWPSGRVDRHASVDADRSIRVVEGKPNYDLLPTSRTTSTERTGRAGRRLRATAVQQ